MPLVDPFGRRINYLRLSVTDRCNLRCRYCMPEKRVPERNHRGILGYEDLMGPAREYKIGGAAGTIGIITPISCGFCGDCNRIRVTAKGIAKGCLFESSGLDLTPFLGKEYDPAALMSALRGVVSRKPEKHGLSDRTTEPKPFLMSQVGG